MVHQGDIKDLSPEIMDRYFRGELEEPGPATSCAYKHFLSYWDMLSEGTELALILEDDIYLYKHFCLKLEKIIKECRERELCNYIISLEDSSLQYVKGSLRKKNQLLYKEKHGRMTGAYLIDLKGAQTLIKELEENKCYLPIDWFHNTSSEKGIIDIFWAQPPLAIQGSLSGEMSSIIDEKKTGTFSILSFKFMRLLRRFLYRFR